MNFLAEAFAKHILCLFFSTKAFMCYVLNFFEKKGFMCLIGHVLIKNECTGISRDFKHMKTLVVFYKYIHVLIKGFDRKVPVLIKIECTDLDINFLEVLIIELPKIF